MRRSEPYVESAPGTVPCTRLIYGGSPKPDHVTGHQPRLLTGEVRDDGGDVLGPGDVRELVTLRDRPLDLWRDPPGVGDRRVHGVGRDAQVRQLGCRRQRVADQRRLRRAVADLLGESVGTT